MPTYYIKAKLQTLTRINASSNGNPRYLCELKPLEDEPINPMILTGSRLVGKTASDAVFAYNMPSPGNWVRATYHVTSTGKVIYDSMEVM